MKVDGGLVAASLADVPARARELEDAGYDGLLSICLLYTSRCV